MSIVLLSGVQQSDGLREEAISRSAGSGPDAAGTVCLVVAARRVHGSGGRSL